MKKTFGTAAIAIAAVLTAGCSALPQFEEKNVVYREIDTNLIEVHVVLEHSDHVLKAKELAYARAMDYCNSHNMGAQMLEGVSGAAPAGGYQSRLVFRCVRAVRSPVSDDFVDHSAASGS